MDWERQFLKCPEDLDAALAREAALREELAEIKESLTYRGSLLNRTQQRANAAEQRNAAFQDAAIEVISNLGEHCCGLQSQSDVDYITEQLDKLAVLIKPTESGASHTATRIDQ